MKTNDFREILAVPSLGVASYWRVNERGAAELVWIPKDRRFETGDDRGNK